MRCFQSMWTKRTCRRSARHSRTRPGNGAAVAWQPGRIAGRASGVEVYKFESTELRARDSIRRTRNDADLGLVNSQTAEVTAVADVRDPSVLRIGPDDEPTPRRPRRRAQPATRSVPFLCVEGPFPGREPPDDREASRASEGPNHRPLRTPCAGFREGSSEASFGKLIY